MLKKKFILFIGVVVILLHIAVFSIAVFIGHRYGVSFLNTVKTLSETLDLKFYLFNFICILLSCISLYSKGDLFKNVLFYIVVLSVILILLVINLSLVS